VNQKKALFFILFLGLFLRLFLIFQPVEFLLEKILDDDAFYYSSLVKNMAEGKGVVFNLDTPTNGFHPLFTILLFPIFKILLPFGIDAPIYGTLVLLSIFDFFTAIFIYLICKKLATPISGIFGAFLWSLNPWIIFTSLIGVEMPLQILLLSILIFLILTWKELNYKRSALLGVLLGLIFLARMDGIFFVIGLLFTFRHSKKNVLIFLLTSLFTVAPWLVWSHLHIGTIFPISGTATQLLRLIENGYWWWVAGSIYVTGAYFMLYFSEIFLPLPWNFLQIIPFLAIFCALGYSQRQKLKEVKFLALPILLYFMYYWFFQIGLRRWYSLFISFFITLFVSIILKNKIKKRTRTIFTIFILLFSMNAMFFYNQGNSPLQLTRFEAAKYINQNLSNARIGSFNTGTLQYFTEADIFNLDGVMNPESYNALRTNKTVEYVLSKVDYIVETERDLERLNLKTLFNLNPIASFKNLQPQKPYLNFEFSKFSDETLYIFEIAPLRSE